MTDAQVNVEFYAIIQVSSVKWSYVRQTFNVNANVRITSKEHKLRDCFYSRAVVLNIQLYLFHCVHPVRYSN